MAEGIARAHRDHRETRPRPLEERRGGREPAAVMRDLEDEGAPGAGALQEQRLAAGANVTGEQQRHPPPVEPQHEGLVVGRLPRIRAGAEHGDHRTAEPQALAGRQHAAGRA
jgi:hypothetical protein